MHKKLLNDLSSVVAPIESAATLPPSCYRDNNILEIEKQAIFGSSWIGLGRSDQWQSTGDYSAITIAKNPIIIIRDKELKLRGFANTCRHRGSMLLDGTGNVQSISCPFHRWTYGLDGALRGAPEMPNLDKAEHGLTEFRVAEREGFSFVSFNNDIKDIGHWLGDFSNLHAPWNLSSLVSTRRIEFEVDCNWKAFLEVFNEYYHLPYVHPDSINNVYARPDPANTVTGCYSSQFSETEGTGGLLEASQHHALPPIPSLEGRNKNGTRYTWLFPNMTFAASTEAIWVYETTPLEPGRCKVVMTVCFPPETINHKDFKVRSQVYYDRMDAALAEDIPALVRYQQGLTSPHAKQGRFCAELEPSVANFAIWYAQQMKKSLSS